MLRKIKDNVWVQISVQLLLVIGFVVLILVAMGQAMGNAISDGVEYKKIPGHKQNCVAIQTSDMGTMYMCEK